MKKTKVIIAEDMELNAQGLELIIRNTEDFEVVDIVANGKLLMQSLNKYEPEIILLDINMPHMDGFDAATAIRKQFPRIRVVFLSVLWDASLKSFIEKHELSGYLSKNVSANDLKKALADVRDGKRVIIPPSPLFKAEDTPEYDSLRKKLLTPREKVVICMVVKGFTSEDIAEHLKMSVNTVRTHRANVHRKLDIGNDGELGLFAAKNGLCD